MPNIPWIGVDLDGTLAEWHGDIDTIGAPLMPMVREVTRWLSEGRMVKIMTARVACTGEYVEVSQRHDDEQFAATQKRMIEEWCLKNIGMVLPVVCSKDFGMIALYDDRAIPVKHNVGTIGTPFYDFAP
jgi:hypothetical protein